MAANGERRPVSDFANDREQRAEGRQKVSSIVELVGGAVLPLAIPILLSEPDVAMLKRFDLAFKATDLRFERQADCLQIAGHPCVLTSRAEEMIDGGVVA